MRTKFFAILAIFLCFAFCSHAQVNKDSLKAHDPIISSTGEDEENDKIFVRVEQEAEFPGGDAAWANYLRGNLDPNVPIRKRARRGTYQVVIRFVVNKKGEISDVNAETSFGHGMEEEAIRVIENGPKWTPAYQLGKPVNAYRRQPITFVVQ